MTSYFYAPSLVFLILMAGSVPSFAAPVKKTVVLFPVVDEDTDSYEFGWDSAMSQLAESLERTLGPGYSLVPEYSVTRLCEEFWRNHRTWTAEEARRDCEDKLHADVSVGVQVTRFSYDVDDNDQRRTACTGECQEFVGRYVDAYGRVWPQPIRFQRCNYEETSFVMHRVTVDAEMEVHLFAYDVNRVATLLSRQKRLRSNKTSSYAETDEDPTALRECPRGSLQDSRFVTPRLAGVPFGRDVEQPDAHDLLWGQWRQFARSASRSIKEALDPMGTR